MKLTPNEKQVLQQNKEVLLEVFDRRINELKNLMVYEKDNRDRKADLIIELEYFKRDLGLVEVPVEKDKENYI